MTQANASRYKRLTEPKTYGQSDGLYYDTTNSRLVVIVADTVYEAPLHIASQAAGDVIQRGSSTWERLGKGSSGRFLRMNAAGTAVSWQADAIVGMSDDFNALPTTAQPPVLRFDGVAFSGATGILHYLTAPSGNVYGVIPKGAGQTLKPAIVANGLDIGGDQTTTEGYEIFSHFMGATGRPFIIGTDAAFYFKAKFEITDADGLDTLFIGFRRAEAQQAAHTSYADYAGMGLNTAADPMALKIITEVNAGGTTVTDTTQTFTQGTAIQVKILVSAAGVVTYQHDIVTPGTLAAPTATAAFTFDTDDPVIPCFHFLNSANLADGVIIHSWDAGYQ